MALSKSNTATSSDRDSRTEPLLFDIHDGEGIQSRPVSNDEDAIRAASESLEHPKISSDSDDSDGDSHFSLRTFARTCSHYFILLVAFIIVVLFLIQITADRNSNHRHIDIAMYIASNLYNVCVILISCVFIHQTRQKCCSILSAFNRAHMCMYLCITHELISCAIFACQFSASHDWYNFGVAITHLVRAFGLSLPSLCIHIYSREKQLLYDPLCVQHQDDSAADREDVKAMHRSAMAAVHSIFGSKMLLGCILLGYLVQIMLFVANPFLSNATASSLELNGSQQILWDINRFFLRPFVLIYLVETAVLIFCSVFLKQVCVNQSFGVLFGMYHPGVWLLLVVVILVDIWVVGMEKHWFHFLSETRVQYYATVTVHSFWMTVHFVMLLLMTRFVFLSKFLYEDHLRRKISMFYGYVRSNLCWYSVEAVLLMSGVLLYLVAVTAGKQWSTNYRFDIYRHWFIFAFLCCHVMLLITLKQNQKCENYQCAYPKNVNYVGYFKMITLVTLCDLWYTIVFGVNYFYTEYTDSQLETLPFAFSFTLYGVLMLNLQHSLECYLHWITSLNHGVELEMSASDSYE